jgi:hypothetical protein
VTGLSDDDIRRELHAVHATLELLLRHHQLRDESNAAVLLRPVIYSPLTLRTELTTKGLAAVLRAEFPDPQGETQ